MANAGANDNTQMTAAISNRLTLRVEDPCDSLEWFERRGGALVSVAESLDTGSAAGRLVLNIMAAVSHGYAKHSTQHTRPSTCQCIRIS